MKLVIIGGGPRGLSVVERIIEWARHKEEVVQITVFDPYGPSGKVWRETQPLSLKMNSVASQVTLFTDETLSTKGPVQKGPNLYEWSQEEGSRYLKEKNFEQKAKLIEECQNLTINEHCSRVLYGIYQQWFYEVIQKRMAEQTSVTFFREEVQSIKQMETLYRVSSKSVEISADKVILALGHQEKALSDFEQELAAYAKEHRLFYSSPKNAADAYLESIQPNQKVIIKGLGLSFFDYITMLTVERGGQFETKNDKLIYHASGKEPTIIAGSHRGFPYHARGVNQKKAGEEYQPSYLKQKRLNKWRKKGSFPAKEFFNLMKREIELAYYLQIIKQQKIEINCTKFIADLGKADETLDVAKRLKLNNEEYWDWSTIEHPEKAKKEEQSFHEFLLEYLQKDIQEAKKGNVDGPLSNAFDSLKDLRDEVRFMLEANLFSDDEREEWLNQWFTPISNFLSIGPPVERTEELKALIEAGIVTILAPNMTVSMENGLFIATSKMDSTVKVSAAHLIEARIPKVDNQRSLNPLTQQLLRDELIQLHTLALKDGTNKLTGALLVDIKTNQLINQNNQLLTGFYCYGIPTEGLHWLTAATARPKTDPWNLREADKIARAIFTELESEKEPLTSKK